MSQIMALDCRPALAFILIVYYITFLKLEDVRSLLLYHDLD